MTESNSPNSCKPIGAHSKLLVLRAKAPEDVQEISKSFSWAFLPQTLTRAVGAGKEWFFQPNRLIERHLPVTLPLLNGAKIDLTNVPGDSFGNFDRQPAKLSLKERNLLLGWIPHAEIPHEGLSASWPKPKRKGAKRERKKAARTQTYPQMAKAPVCLGPYVIPIPLQDGTKAFAGPSKLRRHRLLEPEEIEALK